MLDAPKTELSESISVQYTTKEGGEWSVLNAHSVKLPDGSVFDAHFNGWRPGVLPKLPKTLAPTGPPMEAPPPKVSQETLEAARANLHNSHWDIWKKCYVSPQAPWIPENAIREILENAPGQVVYANIPKSDPINHPHHYARWPIEPIEFILRNKLPAWLANVIKYAMRYDAKDGLKDLYKARSYLDMEIRRLEGVVKFWEVPVAEERRLNAAPNV